MAQRTRIEILIDIIDQLPTNAQGLITAAVMRNVLSNMVDSTTVWFDEKIDTDEIELEAITEALLSPDVTLKLNGALQANNNLSELTDVPQARLNLVLGDSATLNVGTTINTVAAGDDPRFNSITQHMYNSRDFAVTEGVAIGIDFIWLAGWQAVGDSPATVYKKLGGAPSPIELWQFQSFDGAWWEFVNQGEVWIEQLGAKSDLSVDATPNIQACVDFTSGGPIRAGVGQFLINSAISSLIPVNIRGSGTGAGPGSAAQSNDNCTQFLLNYADPTCFLITSNQPSIFKDFQINVNPPFRIVGRGGAGINISAPATTPGGTCANCRIDNVAFDWVSIGVYMFKPSWHVIENCYFNDWYYDAIQSITETGTEGGTGQIVHNYFFGENSSLQRSVIYLGNGYAVIQNNEILGAQIGIQISIANYNAGYVRALDNTIEEQGIAGIFISVAAVGFTLALVELSRNEFAQLSSSVIGTYASAIAIAENSTPWITEANIKDNQTYLGGASVTHYNIQSGSMLSFNGNKAYNYSGNAHNAFSIAGTTTNGGLTSPIECLDNVAIPAQFSNTYILANNSIVLWRDLHPIPTASLPTFCADGSQGFASDGKATNPSAGNYTLIGGGNGTPAFRRASAWLGIYP